MFAEADEPLACQSHPRRDLPGAEPAPFGVRAAGCRVRIDTDELSAVQLTRELRGLGLTTAELFRVVALYDETLIPWVRMEASLRTAAPDAREALVMRIRTLRRGSASPRAIAISLREQGVTLDGRALAADDVVALSQTSVGTFVHPA